jgi:hypothetical protein
MYDSHNFADRWLQPVSLLELSGYPTVILLKILHLAPASSFVDLYTQGATHYRVEQGSLQQWFCWLF